VRHDRLGCRHGDHEGALDVPGYAKTPQAKKLGIAPGCSIALENAPAGWSLTDPPEGVVHVTGSQPADVIISFFTAAAQLAERLPGLAQRIFPDRSLWVAWPRRAGGHTSDITDNIVREHALVLGIVDVKTAAIDEDWSGQRYVWRREHR
jgi:hypothetical protein